MRRATVLLSLLVSALGAGPLAAAEPQSFDVDDLLAMQRVSQPVAAPDGEQVVFALRTIDLEANRGRDDLWLVGTDGKGLRQLTRDAGNESSPQWSPDGRWIYFLSGRGGSSQVWRLPMAGGESEPVTALPLDVGGFLVAPDGARLVVSMEVDPACDTLACTAAKVKARAERPASGEIYDRLFVRHWDTWYEGRRSHLFAVPVAAGRPATDAVDLMQGMDADAPSKPFGGTEEYTFTPDGQGVVFAARDAGRAEPWSTNFDLWHAPLDGSAKPRNLTADNLAWDTQPVFSPDGRSLVYLAMKRPGFEADRLAIMTLPWPAGGTPRELAPDWSVSAGSLLFVPDGRTLLVTGQHHAQVPLFALDVASGKVRTLVAEGHVRSPSLAGGRVVFGLDHLRSPVELHTVGLDGKGLRPITSINRERLAGVRWGEPSRFTFAGWNDEPVEGWVVKPAGFQAGEKYPVAFLIHGGPQGSWGNDFHYRWNPQAYAGAGYGVVMIDFHGSTGYGQPFSDAIRQQHGSRPLEDLQKGLAAALAANPWLDGERACALGASYGGYMINWIAGNWPDRFRCLVNHDGVFDERMMYYSTEELWFPEWEHGGPYWENAEHFEKYNPVNFVENWQTPMLVIHGMLDFRIPYTQGIAAFTALQRRDVPSRLLLFPDENHWVLKPQNTLLWHETVLGWLDRWLREGE